MRVVVVVVVADIVIVIVVGVRNSFSTPHYVLYTLTSSKYFAYALSCVSAMCLCVYVWLNFAIFKQKTMKTNNINQPNKKQQLEMFIFVCISNDNTDTRTLAECQMWKFVSNDHHQWTIHTISITTTIAKKEKKNNNKRLRKSKESTHTKRERERHIIEGKDDLCSYVCI